MAAPYSRRFPGGFVDKPSQTTPVEAAFLNAVEDALIALLGDTPSADEVGVWVGGAGGGLVYQKVTNAQIAAGAAIDKSKLAALNISDADVAAAANIAKSKLGPLNIADADVQVAAAIALTKLADPGAGKVLGSAAGAAAAVYPPGFEVAAFTTVSNFGPTAITTTGNGDKIFDFPAATYEAVPHYFDMYFLVQDNSGAAVIEFRLHDDAGHGTTLIELDQYRTASANPGSPMFCRFWFTPSSGSHTYGVYWKDITTGRTYTMVNSTTRLLARIYKA